jgi:pyridoxamine 5'-phosphate oxidase
VPDAVADEYFATRAAGSQINAWVSEQSQALTAGDLLQRRAAAKAAEYGLDEQALASAEPAAIARPPHWGGYQIRIDRVEFWTEGAGRFHERVVYARSDGTQHWQRVRLQP